MGTWDTGIYDNDDALDWVFNLTSNGLSAIHPALKVMPEGTYFEAPDVCEAIAAADVVARLRDVRAGDPPAPDEVVGWVSTNGDTDWMQLVASAVAAIDRALLPDNNELHDLWAETDSMEEWRATLSGVLDRLTRV